MPLIEAKSGQQQAREDAAQKNSLENTEMIRNQFHCRVVNDKSGHTYRHECRAAHVVGDLNAHRILVDQMTRDRKQYSTDTKYFRSFLLHVASDERFYFGQHIVGFFMPRIMTAIV